jgi:hypothetical protein
MCRPGVSRYNSPDTKSTNARLTDEKIVLTLLHPTKSLFRNDRRIVCSRLQRTVPLLAPETGRGQVDVKSLCIPVVPIGRIVAAQGVRGPLVRYSDKLDVRTGVVISTGNALAASHAFRSVTQRRLRLRTCLHHLY